MKNKIESGIITNLQDAQRYRFLRDPDNWGEDSGEDSWLKLSEASFEDFDQIVDRRLKSAHADNILKEKLKREYDDPHMSKWLVSVDKFGAISVLDTPDIDPDFLSEGSNAESLHLPIEVCNTAAGVYIMTCGCYEEISVESGKVVDYQFELEKLERVGLKL